jgi:hypothetical protein
MAREFFSGLIEVIAGGLRRKASLARGPGRAVRRDPVAKARRLALEPAAAAAGVVPLVVPDALDEQSHIAFLPRSVLL